MSLHPMPLNPHQHILIILLKQFIAFFAGYITQNIHHTVWIGLGGSVITFLVCVPPWPFYNENAVKWLPAKTLPKGYANLGAQAQGFDITVDGKKVQ